MSGIDPSANLFAPRRKFGGMKRALAGYAVSVVTVAVATVVTTAMWDLIRPQVSPVFFAAVMISAWFGGLGPGLFATALAGFVSIYFFVEPKYSFDLSVADLLRLAVFTVVAMLISWLNGRKKIAEEGLERARLDLEQKVAMRTSDLQQANAELNMRQKQLREMSARLSQTEEEERRRIASALHDGLGQILTVAQLRLDEMVESHDASNLATAGRQIRSLLDEAVAQTRSLTMDLSPPVLYELGLQSAIDWLAQEMEKRYGLFVQLDAAIDIEPDEATRSMLFHAIRELLINVAKHARAGSATVRLTQDGEFVCVVVEDRGVGFDPAQALSVNNGRKGFGLFNIRERIQHMQGTLDITPRTGGGTRVCLRVPAPVASSLNR